MRKAIVIIFLCIPFVFHANNTQIVSTGQIGLNVLKKGLEECNITLYQGSLLLQGMSELALAISS